MFIYETKNPSGGKRAWHNATFPSAMLGFILLAGCGTQPTRNATIEAMPTMASLATSAPTERIAAPTLPDATPTAAPKPASEALPADVVAFKARRDECDHFRGEDPGDDEARAAELTDKLEKTCKGSDAELAALRRHYATDPTVTAALASYEDSVE